MIKNNTCAVQFAYPIRGECRTNYGESAMNESEEMEVVSTLSRFMENFTISLINENRAVSLPNA